MTFINGEPYTLSEVINKLKQEGYTEDFNLHDSCAVFDRDPSQFVIEKTYRFDNLSDPADQCVLYAVCYKKRNIKGILLNSYGIYNEPETSHLLENIQTDYTKNISP